LKRCLRQIIRRRSDIPLGASNPPTRTERNSQANGEDATFGSLGTVVNPANLPRSAAPGNVLGDCQSELSRVLGIACLSYGAQVVGGHEEVTAKIRGVRSEKAVSVFQTALAFFSGCALAAYLTHHWGIVSVVLSGVLLLVHFRKERGD
jgi:hypothetical protein